MKDFFQGQMALKLNSNPGSSTATPNNPLRAKLESIISSAAANKE